MAISSSDNFIPYAVVYLHEELTASLVQSFINSSGKAVDYGYWP
jgi:hypothetical protein